MLEQDASETADMDGADHDDARTRVLGRRPERPGRRLAGEREPLDIFNVQQRERGACEHRLGVRSQPVVGGGSVEAWLSRLVPENDPHFEHTLEGADDMPSHIKMALTRTSETVPIADGKLLLGTWQGIYLWEHRRAAHSRRLIVTIIG